MKTFKILLAALLLFSFGCKDEFIDDIQRVDPGPDEENPEVMIKFPLDGTMIRVTEDVTPINIQLEVTDDIEIQTISVSLDGNEIASFDNFIDYRRAIEEFTYENLTNGQHTLSITATDINGKTTTSSVNFEKVPPYDPVYDGEIFYLPFDGDYMELVSITEATTVGDPGFAGESAQGLNAYAGATGSYLTLPTTGLLNNEISASFWYKVNADPTRAGILVIGPPDPNNPNSQNNRTAGFRFFREGGPTNQIFKLNVGNGDGENWFDGGAAASIDPTSTTGWVHMAFTISETSCAVYINGEVVSQGSFPGISWAECDILSIGSGAPRFTGFNHLSDLSFIDELRFFNKALTAEEVQEIMENEQP